MANVKFLHGIDENLSSVTKKEGQIYFTDDTKKIYYDVSNNLRIGINAFNSDTSTLSNKTDLIKVSLDPASKETSTSSTIYTIPFFKHDDQSEENYYGIYENSGLKYKSIYGKTSTLGNSTLILGNNIAQGTENNKEGILRLYGINTGYTDLQANINSTSTNKVYLPSATTAYLAHIPSLTAIGSATKPVYIDNTGKLIGCSNYAGGTKVTLNNADKGASTATIYAPTTGGTSGYILKANGTTSAPTWVAQSTMAVGGTYQYDLGNMSGKTITDLRTSLDTWLNTYCNYANASARFVCTGNWINLWNAENTTDTIEDGVVWVATIVGTYRTKAYTQLRITTYIENKAVYYLSRYNSTWKKVYKVGFTDDYVKKSGDTMTGNLIVSHSDTTASSVAAKNSLSTISLNAATTGNRGLYDSTKSTWLIYNDTNGYTYYRTRVYNPSSSVQCYLPFSSTSGSTGQYERYINNGIRYLTKEGTASATGYGGLQLGNNTNKGTAGNKYGFLRMYGENKCKVDLRPNLTGMTNDITVTLPKVTSRLLGTGDITFGTAAPSRTATTGDIYIQI